MSDLDKKFYDYQLKKKKTKRDGLFLLIIGLIAFAFLFMYNIYTKRDKQLAEEASAYIEREMITHEEKDSILNAEKRKQDDSINKTIQQLKNEILELKSLPEINNGIRQKIDAIEDNLYKIESITDRVIVRYYKRKADDGLVEKAVKSIKYPSFYLHFKNVPNDDNKKVNNTLYYGQNVEKEYVELLYNRLINYGVKIAKIKPFLSAKGFEWKKNAIEIGYEKPESKTEENAKFFVNIYCFKPNSKKKLEIRDKLEAKGFHVKLYTDWKEKPSFFSDESTVFYYHKSQIEKARSIAKTISELTKVKFRVKSGVGYSILTKKNKDILTNKGNEFVIHYNGSDWDKK